MDSQSYFDKLEQEWQMPFPSNNKVANKWEQSFERMHKHEKHNLNEHDRTEWIRDWSTVKGEHVLFYHNDETWEEALDYYYPERKLPPVKDDLAIRWVASMVEKNNKGKKHPKFIGRMVTLTDGENTLTEEMWHKAIEQFLHYKNVTPFAWKYTLERTLKGVLHCHILLIYELQNGKSNRHEGLGENIYKKHWKHGFINMKKMNFKNNPNAITDALHYLSKEVDAIHRQSENWDMLLI